MTAGEAATEVDGGGAPAVSGFANRFTLRVSVATVELSLLFLFSLFAFPLLRAIGLVRGRD